MKFFEIDEKSRVKAREFEPHVKGAIIELCHTSLGIDVLHPCGIFKYEGGVTIDRKEFVIKINFVAYDWSSERCELPDTEALVVSVIELVMNKLIWLDDFTERFTPCESGDPLRDILGL